MIKNNQLQIDRNYLRLSYNLLFGINVIKLFSTVQFLQKVLLFFSKLARKAEQLLMLIFKKDYIVVVRLS